MKHLWISVSILIVLFCALIGNNMYLSSLIEPLSQQLSQAAQLAQEEQWEQAHDLMEQAQAKWEEKGAYLHTLLQHKDIDEVVLLFQEADQYLECQKIGEYSAVNARLITQLDLIREMEELSLHNIF